MRRADRVRSAPAQIEVRIGELIIDDLGTGAPDALVAALTTELQTVLARELAWYRGPRAAARAAGLSAARVRATMVLPPAVPAPDAGRPAAGGAGTAAGTGAAIGAALARAVAGQPDPAGPGR